MKPFPGSIYYFSRAISIFSFPSPVEHISSELSTITRPSCMALHSVLIVSLSYTRLWSMWSDWLVFCDCGFQSVCPLMEKGKRLMEASWWERLTEGQIGSCSDELGHVQQIFNSISCWWVGLQIADSDCSHEIKRCLLLGRKVMINLDSILKSRDITLPTKVCLIKAMDFHIMDVIVGL